MRRKGDNFRGKQGLGRDVLHLVLCHQLLEQDPFMGGMLINEVQTIGTFRYEISSADLADQA